MPRAGIGARRLVIDASIAYAAGTIFSLDPRASSCRDLLEIIGRKSYKIVMYKELLDEWTSESSPFAQEWLVKMVTAKHRVIEILLPDREDLHEKVRDHAPGHRKAFEMEEDLHLIKAALVTDRTILSCDKEAQTLFAKLTKHAEELKPIVWMDADDTYTKDWIQGNALYARVQDRTLEAHAARLDQQ